jgi:two-component system chemotaxis response regulator CheY
MAAKILLIEPSRLHAASLKARLESLGAEVLLISKVSELGPLLQNSWEFAITDSQLPDSPSGEHFDMLKSSGKPVILWSDELDLVNDAAKLASLGVEKAFRKLSRADLVVEVERRLGLSGPALGGNRRFLVVEDSPTVRVYVRKVLAERFPGAEVMEAEDGKGAISSMKTGRVDLIVTDLQMPGMDGQAFVQTLRHNAILARKPIIILSGMITAKVREEMQGTPRLRLLSKPASPEALEEAVKSLLGESPVAGAEAGQ